MTSRFQVTWPSTGVRLHQDVQRVLEGEQQGGHRHRREPEDLGAAPEGRTATTARTTARTPDIGRRDPEVGALEPHQEVRQVRQGEGRAARGPGPSRRLDDLQPGQDEGGPEAEPARAGHDQVDDGPAQGGAVACGPAPRGYTAMKTAKRQAQHGQALGMAAVDGGGDGQGQEDRCRAVGARPRTRRMAAAKIHPAQHVTPVMAQPE